jgi:thioredoxin reductase
MEREQLVVVGAGVAGTSAATEAAKAGLRVTLIDENPLDLSTMAMDVPLMYGQRFMPSVGDKALMLERVISCNGLLGEAVKAGVNVRLGTSVWGSFGNQEHLHHLEAPVLGLADQERSWLMEYERLILAPGARDLVLGFPGWDSVGVMGAGAFLSLANRYRALTARKVVVLGSGALGLRVAATAVERGLDVTGLVDVTTSIQGDVDLAAELRRTIPFFLSHTVKETKKAGDEAHEIVLTGLNGAMRPTGPTRTIECDTVVLAVGQMPMVELAYLTGCKLTFQPEAGGWVPELNEGLETSVPGVYAAGDASGVHDEMVTHSHIAAAQGLLAGLAAARSLQAIDPDRADKQRTESKRGRVASRSSDDVARYRQKWFDSLANASDLDVMLCRCEEVTRRDILDMAPPRYLNWSSEPMRRRNLQILAQDGPVDPDQVKRLTRAGMGYCQGRRCREQVAMLLAQATGTPLGEIPVATYRPPVRPVPLKVIWADDEPQHTRDEWTSWFRFRPPGGVGVRPVTR